MSAIMSRVSARLVLGMTACYLACAVTSVFADSLLIKNATVHTLSDAGVLAKSAILIKNGKIVAVGPDVTGETDSRIIDAAGKPVTPGLMDPYTYLGLVEIDAVESTADHGTKADEIGASFRVADVMNPNSTLIPLNRAMGITRAVVMPSVQHDLFGGQGAIVSLQDGLPLIRENVVQIASYGSDSLAGNGGSRASALIKFENLFDDARDYAANKAAFQHAQRRSYAASFRDLEALQAVLDNSQKSTQTPLLISANRAADIRTLLRLKQRFNLNLMIVGGAEAHLLGNELKTANVPVLLDPMANTPDSFDALAATFENAARLNNAGVRIAFHAMGESSGHMAYLIRQGAGNAVAHGLPYEVALAAITRTPSELFGTGKSFGQIASGFDADVVLWDGDPLEVTSVPTYVIIAGKEQSLVTRESRLRDRYLKNPQGNDRAYRR